MPFFLAGSLALCGCTLQRLSAARAAVPKSCVADVCSRQPDLYRLPSAHRDGPCRLGSECLVLRHAATHLKIHVSTDMVRCLPPRVGPCQLLGAVVLMFEPEVIARQAGDKVGALDHRGPAVLQSGERIYEPHHVARNCAG